MRVVAGRARGRPLLAPPGQVTRPTSDRVREAMFNMLTSMDAIEGTVVADLFAGTGALGIEAISRGAASAVFVDSWRPAVDAIRANLQVLDDPDLARVVCAEASGWIRGLGTATFDIVFADPPYAWAGWADLTARLAPRTRLLVAETGKTIVLGPEWETARSRRYGTTIVTVARPAQPPTEGQAEDPDLRIALQPTHPRDAR
jgi:16S rRNA (guanine966-N2)-methyltransferase